METFSALLAICAGNSLVPGEFPTQRPETRSYDVFLDLRLNKRLSKQPSGWWFESLLRPLLRHYYVRNEVHQSVTILLGAAPGSDTVFINGATADLAHESSGESAMKIEKQGWCQDNLLNLAVR